MKSYYYFLLLLLVSGNLKAQTPLTIGEVYDFNVGDEFHYHYSYTQNYPYNVFEVSEKVVVVLAKSYSANFDTIFYAYQNTHYEYSPYPNLVVDRIDTTHQFVTGLGNPQFTGSPITYSVNYNGRVVNNKIMELILFEPNWGCEYTYYTSETCIEGCGCYTDSWTGCNYSDNYFRETLVYFKKGEETWSVDVGIVPNESMDMGSRVYPNPATNQLHIIGNMPAATFVLYNLLGQAVRQVDLGNGTVQVSVSGLPVGTYVYQIINPQKQTLQYGKVSVLH